jgi:SH3-like domain-containing protein
MLHGTETIEFVYLFTESNRLQGACMNLKPMLTRITTLALAGALTIGTTGCDAVMGVFGMGESTPAETESVTETAQTLLPTPTPPVLEVDATPTEEASEPLPAVVEEPIALAQPAQSAPARRAVTITGPSVNLRSQPGTDAQILRTVAAGTQFDFVDQNGAGDWYQVCCVDNQMAWVFAELANVEEAVALPQNGTALQVPALAAASTANQGPKMTTAVRPVSLNIPLTPPVFTQSDDANGIHYEFSEQGFAITLPREWQPVDLSADRMTDSLSAFAGANPQAATIVEAQLQSIANARFTFFAAELSPTVLDTGFATNVSLLRQPLPTGITLDFYSQLIAKQVQEKFELTAPVALAPGSLPAGKLVALSYKMRGANGELAVTTYLIMQAQTVYDLTFTTTSAQAESYASTFALIAKSFRLLEQ